MDSQTAAIQGISILCVALMFGAGGFKLLGSDSSVGGPSLLNIYEWEWNWFEKLLILVIVNSFLCLLDFAQVWISGSEGSHSYGRHSDHKTFASYFPTINNRLGWVYMESSSVIVFLIVFFMGKNCWEPVPFVFMLMWQTHYFQRSFIYPLFLMKSAPGRRQNSLLCTIGFIFNSVNSFLNARMISEVGNYPNDYFSNPSFIVGMILFIIGYHINRRSDSILQRLRNSATMTVATMTTTTSTSTTTTTNTTSSSFLNKKNNHSSDEEEEEEEEADDDASTSSVTDSDSYDNTIKLKQITPETEVYIDSSGSEYRIPFGEFFEYVSSPNYFGEIVEWIGWAIATQSLAGIAFVMFSAGNLVPRAYWNHIWMQKHFKHYPKNRKAIFPGIF